MLGEGGGDAGVGDRFPGVRQGKRADDGERQERESLTVGTQLLARLTSSSSNLPRPHRPNPTPPETLRD